MKTAISIPDKVFKSAEKLANHLGQSRSQLYTQAINSFVTRYQNDKLTQKLDEVYSNENSKLDTGLASLQHRSLLKDRW